jgi:cyclase
MSAGDVPEVFGSLGEYYGLVRETAEAGLAGGPTPLEAARRCDLVEFAGWADAERMVLNLHQEYFLAGGHDLDPMRALGDAVAYNGGRLRTTV